jgi:hypothetical protein
MSSQLLDQLQESETDPIWDDNSDLLLWLLFIGGTFVPPGSLRSKYVCLLRRSMATKFPMISDVRSRTLEIMRKFIWSDFAFASEASNLWGEIIG